MRPLDLEELEGRSLMAAVWNPAANGGFVPFPDFDGPVRQVYVDVTGPEVTGIRINDNVFVAGEGGGCRVRILDGGRGVYEEYIHPVLGPAFRMKDEGRELFNGFAFGDRDARIGLDVAGTADGTVWFTWLTGGGPILSKGRFDGGAFTTSEFLAADENYRGGLLLETGTVRYSALDLSRPDDADLLVMPSPSAPDHLRGGPVLRVYTADGDQLSILYDDADDRTEHRLGAALIGVLADPETGEYGFVMDGDNGHESKLFTWNGRLVNVTRDDDPDADWRNANPSWNDAA